jgi:phosphatidylserine/phosphatidylglycerophosphate/cardiolipin synthase-like enzyme
LKNKNLSVSHPGFFVAVMFSLWASPVSAGEAGSVVPAAAGNVRAEVFFTPEADAAGQIVAAIGRARQQVLVQAFSFTHGGIAQALIAAHQRGVEVKLIADREQTERMDRSVVPKIAAAGVPVWLDGEHQSAHNKVMVLDGATVITGSFNFTNAGQYRNAENVVFLTGNMALAQAYMKNWLRHFEHARRLTIH